MQAFSLCQLLHCRVYKTIYISVVLIFGYLIHCYFFEFSDHVGHKCITLDAALKAALVDLSKLIKTSDLRKTTLQEAVYKVDSAITFEIQEWFILFDRAICTKTYDFIVYASLLVPCQYISIIPGE